MRAGAPKSHSRQGIAVGARRVGRPGRRLAVLLVMVGLLFAVIAARVVQLQAVNDERLAARGEEQTLRTQTIAADRGSILDRNGYELALSIPLQTVFTDPKFVEDPRQAAEALAPLLGEDPEALTEVLGAENRFGYLARQVPPEVAEEVEALELPGVYLVEEPHRFNPAGDLATSLVGMTDIDNVGLGGLELQYEELLSGSPGELTIEQDPQGRTIAVGEHRLTPASPGDDLVLTLDRSLQYEAERILMEHVAANQAEAAMAVMMDPATGEILAMANVEADEETGEPVVSTNNRSLTTVFEPGSVMKIVGMSGALEEGLLAPGSCVDAPNQISVGGATFKEYEPHAVGCWPIEDVIANSSNTASINIALMLGESRLYRYFKAFGLGDPTGLGFPNELSGYVRPVEEWWGTSIGSMPIGQGISVTPLQMLLAYNTIANGGVFVPPSLVRSSMDGGGVEHLVPRPETRRVLSESTASAMSDMLAQVVSRGTAQSAQMPGYDAAGKTGTAQIPAPDGGYIWPDGTKHYMATFVGFAPADNPRLSLIVVTQHPTAGAYTGGAVSGAPWARLAQFALRHLQIPSSGLVHDPEAPVASAAQPVVGEALGPPPDGRIRAQPASAAGGRSGDRGAGLRPCG